MIADRSGKSQAPTLNEACHVAGRVWSAIISNLELERVNPCIGLESATLAIPISSIVRYFLGQLRRHCQSEAERRCNEFLKMDPPKATNRECRSGSASDRVELFKYNTAIITRSLVYIMSTAAKLHVKHQAIFDAIASVFLQHIGECMGLHLFGDSKTDCVVKHDVPVSGVCKVSIDSSHTKSAAQLEAPHLVEVLRTFAQTLVPENIGCTGSRVLEDLQKTLIQGVFGSQDEQDPFLKYPIELVDSNTAPITDVGLVHDEDGKDWFLTQVWELLGWDVLIG